MKYISIDIETTGLNPALHQILEIGAIIEDTEKQLPRNECPTFHAYIDSEYYICDAYAAALNANIFKKISDLKKANDRNLLIKPEDVAARFNEFLWSNGIRDKITPA